jgi:SAM-dependent methyltransferase
MRQNPRLAWESLKHYYEGDYIVYAPLLRDVPSRWRRLDRRYGMWKQMRFVKRSHPGGGRLLDVGSGTGIFLEEVLRSGRWQAIGLEPTEKAAAYTRDALKIEVHTGRFSDSNLPLGAFDVITLWNVLEHVPFPTADLRRALELLRPGGRIIFTVPNVESLEAGLFGRYWVGWDLPRHLYLFPRATLRALLRDLGLTVEAEACISSSHSAVRDSLGFWFQSWPTRMQWLARIIHLVFTSLPIRLATAPIFWVLDRLRRSTILVLSVRRTSEPEARP